MVGEKTNREEKLKRRELMSLLAYDPAKKALGRGAEKTISDSELALVMRRDAKAQANASGHGFAAVDAVVSAFDAASKTTAAAAAAGPTDAAQ
jgi:hypothetical protein